MKPKLPSISACESIVRQSNSTENQIELVVAANKLMQNRESNATISVDDGLTCLDQGGVVAEVGARTFDLLMGRDAIG